VELWTLVREGENGDQRGRERRSALDTGATKAEGGGGKMVFSRAKLGLPWVLLRWQARHISKNGKNIRGSLFCMAIV
jgi:hypothetical protein